MFEESLESNLNIKTNMIYYSDWYSLKFYYIFVFTHNNNETIYLYKMYYFKYINYI